MAHRHRVFVIVIVAAWLATATPAVAVDLPHHFEDGAVISAGEVNENFATLGTELSAALERIAALEAALGTFHAVGTDLGVNTTASPFTVESALTVETALAAWLVLDYAFSCTSFSGGEYTRWRISPRVNGENYPRFFSKGLDRENYLEPSGGSGGPSVVVPVDAGVHEVGYMAERQFGDSSLDCGIFISVVVLPRDSREPEGVTPEFAVPRTTGGEER